MQDVKQDVKDAFRQLTHRPGVSLTIVLTLALGIGANALVFSAVRGVLLEPLPYPGPERLVNVWETHPGHVTRGVAPANFLDWRSAASFDGLAAYNRKRRTIGGDHPERLMVATVSANFFDLLGVPALAGRTFRAVAPAGVQREVILRNDFWQRRFGADPSLIGRAITLDDESLVVVGVVARPLAFPEDAVAWTQAPHDIPELGPSAGDLRTIRDAWYFRVVGRLKPAVTMAQAQAEMNGIASRLEAAYPSSNTGAGVRLVGLQEQLTETSASTLWILLGVVGCVLAIACANIATLMLASATGRARELAIRAALGASNFRLVRQRASESLLLACAGGTLGLAVAMLGRPALLALLPAGTPRLDWIAVDSTVLLFTIGLSITAALAFGTAPALMSSGSSNFAPLRDGGRSGQSRRGTGMTAVLVAGQLAAALVLITGTGLMLRALWTVYQRDVGIDIERLLVLDVTVPEARTRGRAAAARDVARMTERLSSLPGATAAAAIQSLPLSGGGASATLRAEGMTFSRNEAPDVAWRAITPAYFDTVGARVVRGRPFTEADREDTQPVTIINEALARRLWPGADPIGARIGTGLDGDGAGVTVIGVVGNIPQENIRSVTGPEMYRPLAQPSRRPTDAMSLIVRTDGDPRTLSSAAREAVRQVHPQAAVGAVRTMSAVVDAGIATELTAARALAIFGGLSLLLAGTGLYGVMSRLVADRSRELGVRIALGAAPAAVGRLVLARTMKIAAAGVAVGAGASAVLSRYLGSSLHGIGMLDPLTFASAAAVLVTLALLASYLPARRASRIDPISVMKVE